MWSNGNFYLFYKENLRSYSGISCFFIHAKLNVCRVQLLIRYDWFLLLPLTWNVCVSKTLMDNHVLKYEKYRWIMKPDMLITKSNSATSKSSKNPDNCISSRLDIPHWPANLWNFSQKEVNSTTNTYFALKIPSFWNSCLICLKGMRCNQSIENAEAKL